MDKATGTFDLTRWDEDLYDEGEGAKLAKVAVGKTFHGDIDGTSTATLLTAVAQVPTSMAYVGIERVTASVGGKAGTFVLRHSATGTAEGGDLSVVVVPDSGTGELRSLRGDLSITRHEDGSHTYSFEYSLD